MGALGMDPLQALIDQQQRAQSLLAQTAAASATGLTAGAVPGGPGAQQDPGPPGNQGMAPQSFTPPAQQGPSELEGALSQFLQGQLNPQPQQTISPSEMGLSPNAFTMFPVRPRGFSGLTPPPGGFGVITSSGSGNLGFHGFQDPIMQQLRTESGSRGLAAADALDALLKISGQREAVEQSNLDRQSQFQLEELKQQGIEQRRQLDQSAEERRFDARQDLLLRQVGLQEEAEERLQQKQAFEQRQVDIERARELERQQHMFDPNTPEGMANVVELTNTYGRIFEGVFEAEADTLAQWTLDPSLSDDEFHSRVSEMLMSRVPLGPDSPGFHAIQQAAETMATNRRTKREAQLSQLASDLPQTVMQSFNEAVGQAHVGDTGDGVLSFTLGQEDADLVNMRALVERMKTAFDESVGFVMTSPVSQEVKIAALDDLIANAQAKAETFRKTAMSWNDNLFRAWQQGEIQTPDGTIDTKRFGKMMQEIQGTARDLQIHFQDQGAVQEEQREQEALPIAQAQGLVSEEDAARGLGEEAPESTSLIDRLSNVLGQPGDKLRATVANLVEGDFSGAGRSALGLLATNPLVGLGPRILFDTEDRNLLTPEFGATQEQRDRSTGSAIVDFSLENLDAALGLGALGKAAASRATRGLGEAVQKGLSGSRIPGLGVKGSRSARPAAPAPRRGSSAGGQTADELAADELAEALHASGVEDLANALRAQGNPAATSSTGSATTANLETFLPVHVPRRPVVTPPPGAQRLLPGPAPSPRPTGGFTPAGQRRLPGGIPQPGVPLRPDRALPAPLGAGRLSGRTVGAQNEIRKMLRQWTSRRRGENAVAFTERKTSIADRLLEVLGRTSRDELSNLSPAEMRQVTKILDFFRRNR